MTIANNNTRRPHSGCAVEREWRETRDETVEWHCDAIVRDVLNIIDHFTTWDRRLVETKKNWVWRHRMAKMNSGPWFNHFTVTYRSHTDAKQTPIGTGFVVTLHTILTNTRWQLTFVTASLQAKSLIMTSSFSRFERPYAHQFNIGNAPRLLRKLPINRTFSGQMVSKSRISVMHQGLNTDTLPAFHWLLGEYTKSQSTLMAY